MLLDPGDKQELRIFCPQTQWAMSRQNQRKKDCKGIARGESCKTGETVPCRPRHLQGKTKEKGSATHNSTEVKQAEKQKCPVDLAGGWLQSVFRRAVSVQMVRKKAASNRSDTRLSSNTQRKQFGNAVVYVHGAEAVIGTREDVLWGYGRSMDNFSSG